ncbi:Zn(2+) transporter [Martiniozyma asiatica (nom. inval.)]|nr:Zn(2+) transporter [Martiniozyma asiatica]
MQLTKKELKIITLLVIDTAFFLLEIIIGYAVNSLALIADSFHMLNDIISLLVALWAVNVAKSRAADADYTYGWLRAEILGALINAVFLIALCFTIFIEAIQRLLDPPTISNAKLILIVGTCGLISNIVGLFLFHEHGHSHGGGLGGGHSHSHVDDLEAGHSHGNSEFEHGHDHTHSNHHDDHGHGNLTQSTRKSFSERTPLISSALNDSNSDIQQLMPSYVVRNIENSTENIDGIHSSHNDSSIAAKTKAKQEHQKSLNMQGVFLHVLGDALGNVGVMATALFIWKSDYSWKYYSDPAISLVITCIIFSSALPLCKSSSRILLQGTPTTVDTSDVVEDIINIPGVISVHDFHIWNLTERMLIASLHVEMDTSPDKFLETASKIKTCLHNYGVHSATIQPEFSGYYERQKMLPRGFSSSQNLAQDAINSGNRGDNSGINNGQNPGAFDVYTSSSRNNSTRDIHCLVDAKANCTTLDCIQ